MSNSQSEYATVRGGTTVRGTPEMRISQSSSSTERGEFITQSDSDEAEVPGLAVYASQDDLACIGHWTQHHDHYDDPKSFLYSVDIFSSHHTTEKLIYPVEISGTHFDDEGYEGDQELEDHEFESEREPFDAAFEALETVGGETKRLCDSAASRQATAKQ